MSAADITIINLIKKKKVSVWKFFLLLHLHVHRKNIWKWSIFVSESRIRGKKSRKKDENFFLIVLLSRHKASTFYFQSRFNFEPHVTCKGRASSKVMNSAASGAEGSRTKALISIIPKRQPQITFRRTYQNGSFRHTSLARPLSDDSTSAIIQIVSANIETETKNISVQRLSFPLKAFDNKL